MEPHTATSSRHSKPLLIALVLGYGAAIMAYTLLMMPARGKMGPLDIMFIVLAGVFPVAINWLCGDRPRDSGIRFDNLRSAFGPVAIFTLISAAVVVAVGLAFQG